MIGIDLSSSGTAYANAGLTANKFIQASQFYLGASAADASDRFIYDISTGALYFDVDGSGAAVQVQIATLTTKPAITHNHIFVFTDAAQLPNAPGNNSADPLPTENTPPNPPPADPIPGNDIPAGNSPPAKPTAGNDILTGNKIDETIDGQAGDDLISGLDGNDLLLGSDGNDTLNGGNGNDQLQGGNGNDLLYGGTGSDRLWGDSGKDCFVLERGLGRDTIYDFRDRIDRIGLQPGLRFNQLIITQQGKNILISTGKKGNDPLALLIGVRIDQISSQDFKPVAAV